MNLGFVYVNILRCPQVSPQSAVRRINKMSAFFKRCSRVRNNMCSMPVKKCLVSMSVLTKSNKQSYSINYKTTEYGWKFTSSKVLDHKDFFFKFFTSFLWRFNSLCNIIILSATKSKKKCNYIPPSFICTCLHACVK
jgi:hypothetical protein